MNKRAYLSNVTAVWPLSRQREMLATLEGWPDEFVVFEDDLNLKSRRRIASNILVRRNEMLRATTRKGGEEAVFVAATSVFALSIEDMMEVLTLAGIRGASVHFIHEGITVAPSTGAEALHRIALAYAQAKREGRAVGAGRISADKRKAEAKADCERIRTLYAMPSREVGWAELQRVSGRSRNTIIAHLGERRGHQVQREANLKRAATRAKRQEERS